MLEVAQPNPPAPIIMGSVCAMMFAGPDEVRVPGSNQSIEL